MAKDLRTFLTYLEEHLPESLLFVDTEIDPRFEAAGILSKLEQEGRYPAIVFRKIKGSPFPVVSNMHADPERLYSAMGLRGTALRSVIVEYGRREASPIEPCLVQDGPVKEVTVRGEGVNLLSFPAFTYHEKDAGPYITLGMCVMKDPETGIRNAGIYRLMVKDHCRLGVQISETSHGHYIRQKNEQAGKPTEIAVVIGHHPGFYLGCLSLTGLDVDEFAV
ncbi:MAG: UbiD family decarboxylase domain-containing protein, partial [Candidatus Binatia bacterium]